MRNLTRFIHSGMVIAAFSLLGACGDGGYDNFSCGLCGSTLGYTGTVSGLQAGTSVVLQDNVGATTTVSNGNFQFSTSTPPFFPALVGVLVQPQGQQCTVTNGTPNAAGIVTLGVSCTTLSTPPAALLTDFAGMLLSGSADASGTGASFNGPSGIATDSNGNVYVADTGNSVIRKITPAGAVTTFAGTAGVLGSVDGTGPSASFRYPNAVATDSAGNVYVADTGNNTVRVITSAGVVSTLAGTAGVSGSNDGTGPAASFLGPAGIAVDGTGNVYVADFYNNTIRLITAAGVVSTLAGNATAPAGSVDASATAARFNGPQGLAIDSSGNIIVADTYNNTVRRVTPAGVVTTLAGTAGVRGSGDGTGSAATFARPSFVAADTLGNVYVADTRNSTVRKITAAGVVSTVIGVAGQSVFNAGALPGTIEQAYGVAVSGSALYFADNGGIALAQPLP